MEIEPQAVDKTYRAIGRFMFEFSQLEYAVRHYVGEEIDIKEEYFTAVMESYDVAMLITIAIEVFKKSPGEDAVTIWKLLNRFRSLNDERKRVAHGLWVPFKDGGTVHYVSRNKLTPSQFNEQAAHLEKLAEELCQLRVEFESAVLTFPEIRQHK